MILYPAIDLKGGRCVRLLRGDLDSATEYGDDPAAEARRFAAAGCRWIHVVDLEGAVAGAGRNAAAVEAVIRATGLSVQVGGGIRTRQDIEKWLEIGAARVVLGTAAVGNPELVVTAAAAAPGRIVVAVDTRDGRVATQGWTETSELSAAEAICRFEDAGVAAVLHTDIGRDGTLQGPNLEASEALAAATRIPVILSGGTGRLEDLMHARRSGCLAGVVVGRAIYDGRIDLRRAAALFEEADA